MLRLDVIVHTYVAPGSFPVEVRYDLYDEYFVQSGWRNYTYPMAAMTEWCRERWGPQPGEGGLGVDALWMVCGKRIFLRSPSQAMELTLRWHGASP